MPSKGSAEAQERERGGGVEHGTGHIYFGKPFQQRRIAEAAVNDADPFGIHLRQRLQMAQDGDGIVAGVYLALKCFKRLLLRVAPIVGHAELVADLDEFRPALRVGELALSFLADVAGRPGIEDRHGEQPLPAGAAIVFGTSVGVN